MSNIDAEDIAAMQDKRKMIEETLQKWDTLITKISYMELRLYNLKDEVFNEEQEIIQNTDFKELYNANNEKVRRAHINKVMKPKKDYVKSVETKLDEDKRRLTFYSEKVRWLRESMRYD